MQETLLVKSLLKKPESHRKLLFSDHIFIALVRVSTGVLQSQRFDVSL